MKIDKRTTQGQNFLDDVQFNTNMSKMAIRDMRLLTAKLTLDPSETFRKKEQKCVWCYYKQTVAGSAFTDYTCDLCKSIRSHPNTYTPHLCKQCGEDNNLCMQCGGLINLG